MLSRRALLRAAPALAGAAALGGCALVPSGGRTSLRPAPGATPLPGQDAVVALWTALTLAGRAATTASAEQRALLAWATGVAADQHAAVSLATPTPVASPGPTGSPSPLPTPAPDAVAAAADALATAATTYRTQALDPAAARPLVWASMAAWATTVHAQLPAPTAAREPARGVRLPAPQGETEAAQAALDAAAQALYAVQVAAGAPGLGESEVSALRGRVSFWQATRDALAGAAASATAVPTPAPPWFRVDPPGDATTARALVARVQAAALPVLGRSLAHGAESLRPPLLDALAGAAADVPLWGGLVERWPGLPVT